MHQKKKGSVLGRRTRHDDGVASPRCAIVHGILLTGCCCLGKYCVVVCVREAVVCTEHHVASFCSDRRRRFVRPLGSLGIFRSVPLPPFCLFFFFFSPTSHPSYPSFSHPLPPPPFPISPYSSPSLMLLPSSSSTRKPSTVSIVTFTRLLTRIFTTSLSS